MSKYKYYDEWVYHSFIKNSRKDGIGAIVDRAKTIDNKKYDHFHFYPYTDVSEGRYHYIKKRQGKATVWHKTNNKIWRSGEEIGDTHIAKTRKGTIESTIFNVHDKKYSDILLSIVSVVSQVREEIDNIFWDSLYDYVEDSIILQNNAKFKWNAYESQCIFKYGDLLSSVKMLGNISTCTPIVIATCPENMNRLLDLDEQCNVPFLLLKQSYPNCILVFNRHIKTEDVFIVNSLPLYSGIGFEGNMRIIYTEDNVYEAGIRAEAHTFGFLPHIKGAAVKLNIDYESPPEEINSSDTSILYEKEAGLGESKMVFNHKQDK